MKVNIITLSCKSTIYSTNREPLNIKSTYLK
ncbi:hypothetical protein ESA2_CDS36 [Staphylococcus phage ESa2]|nr:hypothetical protein ESA2_CDS36 [Staphylococcus phage ESa2]